MFNGFGFGHFVFYRLLAGFLIWMIKAFLYPILDGTDKHFPVLGNALLGQHKVCSNQRGGILTGIGSKTFELTCIENIVKPVIFKLLPLIVYGRFNMLVFEQRNEHLYPDTFVHARLSVSPNAYPELCREFTFFCLCRMDAPKRPGRQRAAQSVPGMGNNSHKSCRSGDKI